MKKLLFVVGVIGFLLFFTGLGARDFWAPDEGDFAQVIRELDRDPVVPHLNNTPYAEKPPLFYYAGYVSKKAFGFLKDEQSTRFVSAAFALLTVLFFAATMIKTRGPQGLLPPLMLLVSPLFYWQARYLQVDMLFSSFVVGSLLSYFHFSRSDAKPFLYCAALCLGCAFMTKGPIAVVLVLPVVLANVALQKRLGSVLRKEYLVAIALFLVVVVPWYVIVLGREGYAFLYENIVRQNFMRFFDAWSHKRPVYYYFTTLPLDFFPWSLFLPMGFILAFRAWKEQHQDRFFVLWFVWMFIFLSLSSGKISKYMLPLLPAACVIASLPLLSFARRYSSVVFFLLAAVFLALSGVLLFYGRVRYPEFSLQHAVLAAVCLALSLSLAYLTCKGQPLKAFGALFSALAIVFMVANTSVFAKLNHYKSPRALCNEIKQYVADGTPWVYYGSMRGVYVYYVGQPAIAIDEHHTADLRGLAARQHRFYVLTRKRDFAEMQQALGQVEPVLEEKVGDTAMVFVRYGRP